MGRDGQDRRAGRWPRDRFPIATVNEDSKSSLYTVSGGTVTHYAYTPSPLPHLGGTDDVAAYKGKILISASAPGTAGKAPGVCPGGVRGHAERRGQDRRGRSVLC